MDIDREALVQLFLAESSEQVTGMEESVLRLEAQPDDTEAVARLFRQAHTLKGNASSLGFSAVAGLAHAFEDLLGDLRAGRRRFTADLADLLLRAVDALKDEVPRATRGEEELAPAHQEVLAALRAVRSGDASGERRASPGRRASDLVTTLDVGSASARRTLRVDLDKLDAMMNLVGELVVARGRLGQSLVDAKAGDAALDAFYEAERLSSDLQRLVLETRMVPLGPTFRQFTRTVRDLAATHGKQARLVIEGADVEVDTSVAEKIRDPLTHMIRNAMDHGIESPETRIAAGKDAVATIALRARHEGGSVVIELSDDGAGLQRARILARARARGLVTERAQLSEREIQELIFRPGFSTAESVTELSGRGVGMDVVRRNVASLRGNVEVASNEGQGTTFTLRLPLTLAVIAGFVVAAGGETYVLPMDTVQECVDLPAGGGASRHGTGVLDLRGEPVPYLRLRSALGAGAGGDRESVVVLSRDGGLAGLAVDAVLGEGQVVIKPLDRSLHGVRGIAGCTILGDGRVALILDVPSLMAEALAAPPA
jgi:two-component system, chemotaxis family, sensor kinase CheA